MRHHNGKVFGVHATVKAASSRVRMVRTPEPERVVSNYVAARQAIEQQHGDDDGTEWLYVRARRGMDDDDPITDDSPVARLMEFGLSQREYELLETNRCCTIGKARRLLRLGVIQDWENSGEKTAAAIRRALRRIDEAKGRAS